MNNNINLGLFEIINHIIQTPQEIFDRHVKRAMVEVTKYAVEKLGGVDCSEIFNKTEEDFSSKEELIYEITMAYEKFITLINFIPNNMTAREFASRCFCISYNRFLS